jgi:radical SAM protein with 4Fe4S-binding SPASM domain
MLLYFDHEGNSYPCPRSVVSQTARFGSVQFDNFEEQYGKMIEDLNHQMQIRKVCNQCPAQIACDFDCHT